jgi:tryptophan-rich sensory protein
MAVNVAWTPVFFALEAIAAALAVIGLLAVLVAATIVAFDRVDRRAAALLVPYLLWVSFAAVLNYRFLQLN